MDRFDRIYALHKELRSARHPVPGQVLQQRLECSRATLNRIIEDMRDFMVKRLRQSLEKYTVRKVKT